MTKQILLPFLAGGLVYAGATAPNWHGVFYVVAGLFLVVWAAKYQRVLDK